jgi:hypothetical protein
MLADGLVAAPTFSPQEASVTRFSEDWVAAQVLPRLLLKVVHLYV